MQNARKIMFANVGEYLRQKREQKNISQTEIAHFLGVRPQFISNWERGLSAPPLRLLKQLLKQYGIQDQALMDFLMEQQEAFLRQSLGLKKKKA
jgi:transcriptional regulator with XRE-family HTH domain